MAKKPTVTTLQSGFNSTETLNTNFEALRDSFDNTLSLDGSAPNAITEEAAFAYDDTTDILSVPTIDFGTSGSRQLNSNTVTAATGASISASSFDGTVFRSCKYTVQITNVTTSEYQQTELLAIHNGTNLYITVYANIYTGASALGNFSGTYAANTATVSFAPVIPANNYDIKTIEWLTEI